MEQQTTDDEQVVSTVRATCQFCGRGIDLVRKGEDQPGWRRAVLANHPTTEGGSEPCRGSGEGPEKIPAAAASPDDPNEGDWE